MDILEHRFFFCLELSGCRFTVKNCMRRERPNIFDVKKEYLKKKLSSVHAEVGELRVRNTMSAL